MSIQLASLAEIKAFLEIETSVTTFDSLLNSMLKYVSDRIQTFLNRNLKKEQRTEYFNAGRRRFYVSAFPIDTTATITVVLDTTTETINDDYYIWADEGLLEFDWKTSYIEPKQLYITYTGGYASSTVSISGTVEDILLAVPDGLKYACILQTAFMFRRRKDIGLTSTSMPDGSINTMFASDLLPEVKNILKSFRKAPTDK